MRPRFRPAVLLTVLVLVAAACGNDDEATTTTVIDTIAPAASAAPDGTDPDLETEPTDPAIELVDTGLELDGPIAMAALPGSDLLLVAEREGVVRAVAPSGTGTDLEVVGDPVIDVRELVGSTDGERGLLGLATDASGDLVYLSYTEASEGASRVDEYRLERPAEGAPRAVPSSRRELLAVPQPFSNHNGGHVALAPDGTLLLGLGDGGSADDPGGRAQDPDTLLGKMVRIDPAVDNSGGGNTGAEIHAIGVRNPWRFSFDRETDDLWVADVGQNRFEEITVLRSPADAALTPEGAARWPARERTSAGTCSRATKPSTRRTPTSGPPTARSSIRCSPTTATPDARSPAGSSTAAPRSRRSTAGTCSATSATPPSARCARRGRRTLAAPTRHRPGADTEPAVSAVDLGVELGGTVSFAEDQQGEVYVLSLDGSVARLTAAG